MKAWTSVLLLAGFCGLSVEAAGTVTGSDTSTKFEKCQFSLRTDRDRCFETVMDEVVVKMGRQGTNDDVVLEVCSDYDSKLCCKTPVLSSALSDDWSKNDRETWGERYFGKCKNYKFKVKNGLIATLSKSGTGALNVTSLDIYTKSTEKKVKEIERFQCGNFFLGGGKPIKLTKDCPTGPYTYNRIDSMRVRIGSDGTDDDVKSKICSDANNICCEVKLSRPFSDDWRSRKNETWTVSDFSDCGKLLYKVNSMPRLSFSKDGKDDLTVDGVSLTIKSQGAKGIFKRFDCGGFTLKGDCKVASLCNHELKSCKEVSLTGRPLNTNSRASTRTARTTTTTRTTTKPTTTTTKGKSLLDKILG